LSKQKYKKAKNKQKWKFHFCVLGFALYFEQSQAVESDATLVREGPQSLRWALTVASVSLSRLAHVLEFCSSFCSCQRKPCF
ncbi:unnamed protein product, partial [Prunus brigantina]